VANVSHELRTPLTTVKSYSETLLDGALEQPEIAHEFLQIIDSEADRMALLVSDLLQLSRFDNNQFELRCSLVRLDEVLQNSYSQHKILAEKKNQKYTYTPMKEAIRVCVDVDRIGQVLSNVIGNAIKYSPEGSTIAIFTTVTEGYVKVYIKDNGIGIPKEDLPRIFERFYRVDKARSRAMGGTGLGLAISKEIMELHGGSINAESEYGKGTTMILWIPKQNNVIQT
jgi:two-component system sensor histidine kinase VicK